MWYGNLGGQIEGYQSGLKILQNTVMSRTFCPLSMELPVVSELLYNIKR